MTIDERLERLAERHEALTQTVGIIAAMQRANEERMAALAEAMNRLERNSVQLTGMMNRLARPVSRLTQTVAAWHAVETTVLGRAKPV
jgi:hypothetical protein